MLSQTVPEVKPSLSYHQLPVAAFDISIFGPREKIITAAITALNRFGCNYGIKLLRAAVAIETQ